MREREVGRERGRERIMESEEKNKNLGERGGVKERKNEPFITAIPFL